MNVLRSSTLRLGSGSDRPRGRRARKPRLESLEGRALLSTVVTDTVLNTTLNGTGYVTIGLRR